MEMTPAVAVKKALVDPEAIETLPGTVNEGEVLERETDTAAAAALDSATVQVVVSPDEIVVGVQLSLRSAGAVASKFNEAAREPPLRVAVSVAL